MPEPRDVFYMKADTGAISYLKSNNFYIDDRYNIPTIHRSDENGT